MGLSWWRRLLPYLINQLFIHIEIDKKSISFIYLFCFLFGNEQKTYQEILIIVSLMECPEIQ